MKPLMLARLLCFLAALAGAAPAFSQSATLWYRDTSGTERRFDTPTDGFTFYSLAPGLVNLQVAPAGNPSGYARVTLAPPVGEQFATGPYEGAKNYNFRGNAS